MIKQADVQQLVKQAADQLEVVTQERDAALATKVAAQVERDELATEVRVLKLAHKLVSENLDNGAGYESTVQLLSKKASEGRLDVVEEALALHIPDMGAKIASVGEANSAANSASALSRAEYERNIAAILSGSGE
jgi:hypothetical protein